ncbi:MAG TPA: PVC-type heme-binding CxxCH protein [Pirellulaceae bacterium]|nr:PVC-type heme-binding CxxCH protein [Pirellulaceae bacterium]
MYRTSLLLLLLACPCVAYAQQPPSPPEFPRFPPLEPDEAAKSFECQHGFSMQLVAAEPLLTDPVDLAYDEDGRAYVVEMRDYPFPEEKNAEPKEFIGQVRLLVDDDGDGRMDRSTVFAGGLAWPTSVACWKGGVFVGAAPDIWYFKDTDGDGVADVREKVFTGFSRYNVQAIMNNLKWGLDGRLYGAASGNGGSVRPGDDPQAMPIAVTRRDFSFDPENRDFRVESGGERFGNSFDDWGNRFLCNIRNPVQHVVLPAKYLSRNPLLAVPRAVHDAAEFGDQLRVYRISPPEPWRTFRAQRWALARENMPRSELIGAGFWTSSSGITIYRGSAYPSEFRGNAFIGEVAGNLVHRQVVSPDGVTFKSKRADEETEFVRSSDTWFRAVNFVNAPDGTLHVLDMYREVIEHPWSIPDDIKAKLNLASGNDRGRIWRLAPPGYKVPTAPRLSKATTAALVAHLENENAWWRETAQRLLLERQDKSAVEPLRKVLRGSKSPQARLHALYTLHVLGDGNVCDALTAINDEHAELRRHGVLLSEAKLAESSSLRRRIIELAEDDALIVRFQVAFSLGEMPADPDAISALGRIAARDCASPWLRTAVLSSVQPESADAVVAQVASQSRAEDRNGALELVRELAVIQASGGREPPDGAALGRLSGSARREFIYAYLAGLGRGLALQKRSLADLPQDGTAKTLHDELDSVMTAALDDERPPTERAAAIELTAFLSAKQATDAVEAALLPSQPAAVQGAAMKVAAQRSEPFVPELLVTRFKQLTPPLREQAMTILLSRPAWLAQIVAALELGTIPPGQISIPHRGRILAAKDVALVKRAEKVLGPLAASARGPVIEKYRAALSLQGDTARGALVYKRECAACHKLDNQGHDVGPNLATIRHRSAEEILIHVLDPNREVSPDFLEYSVRLTDGRTLTGLIAGETDSGLTLRWAEGQQETILRREIEEIASSGKSLMPEGVEQKVTVQEMGNLLSYLLGSAASQK